MSDLNWKLVHTHRPEQQQIKKSSEFPWAQFLLSLHLQGSGQGLPWKCFKRNPQKHFEWFPQHKLSQKISWAHFIKHPEFHITQHTKFSHKCDDSHIKACRRMSMVGNSSTDWRWKISGGGGWGSALLPLLPPPPGRAKHWPTVDYLWGVMPYMSLPLRGEGEAGVGGGCWLMNEWMVYGAGQLIT